MSLARVRLYLVLFGALALAAGVVVELDVLSRRANDSMLAGVAIVGGVAMILTGLFVVRDDTPPRP